MGPLLSLCAGCLPPRVLARVAKLIYPVSASACLSVREDRKRDYIRVRVERAFSLRINRVKGRRATSLLFLLSRRRRRVLRTRGVSTMRVKAASCSYHCLLLLILLILSSSFPSFLPSSPLPLLGHIDYRMPTPCASATPLSRSLPHCVVSAHSNGECALLCLLTCGNIRQVQLGLNLTQ